MVQIYVAATIYLIINLIALVFFLNTCIVVSHSMLIFERYLQRIVEGQLLNTNNRVLFSSYFARMEQAGVIRQNKNKHFERFY